MLLTLRQRISLINVYRGLPELFIENCMCANSETKKEDVGMKKALDTTKGKLTTSF